MAGARGWMLGSAVLAAGLGGWLSARGSAPSSPPLDDVRPPAATLQITFGLRDAAPRAWDGRLGTAAGLASVEADREEFASAAPIRVSARVQGTGGIERIEVIKDGAVVFSRGPGPPDLAVEFADTAARPGRSYYYVRVLQADGEMAWSSPAWVTYAGGGR